MNERLEDYLFKTVSHKYYGKNISLATSQELFCCIGVDAGSALLLKTIGENADLSAAHKILDVGCGTGTLALSLMARYPALHATLTDRDALALAFSEYNRAQNKLSPASIYGSLGVKGVVDSDFDLVVSNIPAKAGNGAIENMLKGFQSRLREGGTVAVVIVKTLSDLAERAILAFGGTIRFKHATKEYTVFHYSGNRERGDETLEPYLRGKLEITAGQTAYTLETAYGIGEFDTAGFDTALALRTLGKTPLTGKVLVWNPGQGIIPVAIGNAARSILLAGRDLLALEVSEKNVRKAHGRECPISHAPFLDSIEGQFDCVVVNVEKEAIADAHTPLARNLERLLPAGAEAILTGKSTFVQRALGAAERSFKVTEDDKKEGFRCVRLLKKESIKK